MHNLINIHKKSMLQPDTIRYPERCGRSELEQECMQKDQ